MPASLKLIPLSKIKENITQTHKNLTGNADVFWGCVSARTNCGAAKFDLQNGMQLGKGGGEGAGKRGPFPPRDKNRKCKLAGDFSAISVCIAEIANMFETWCNLAAPLGK